MVSRFASRASEDDALRRWQQANDRLGEVGFKWMSRGEYETVVIQRLIENGAKASVVVAKKNRAKRAMEVYVLITIDIPKARPLRFGHVDRVGIGRGTPS